MTGRIPSDPQPTAETQPFWDAAGLGRFLIKRCRACTKAHWYPRTYCPFCASADTEWTEAGGGGTIYSYSVMRRADPVYVMAYVTLDEGPTMMTNIVDCEPDVLAVGARVSVVFKPSPGGFSVPMFSLTPDARS
jgi:uncharacterized protein